MTDYAIAGKRWYERESSLALLARRVSFFSVPLLVIVVGLFRLSLIDLSLYEPLLSVAFGMAALGFLLAISAFLSVWFGGGYGWRNIVFALIVSTGMLAVPGFALFQASQLPRISDVTTDTENPPPFDKLRNMRLADNATIAHPGREAAELQFAAYPELEPASIPLPLERVFEIVIDKVRNKGWRLAPGIEKVNQKPAVLEEERIAPLPVPDPRRALIRQTETLAGNLSIEATATTLIFGFPDDVSIRIEPGLNSTIVHMRSASRLPANRSDIGTNARRVAAFLEELRRQTREAPRNNTRSF